MQPSHQDRHASKLNITLVMAIGVIVIGVLGGGNPLLVIVGVVFGLFSWLTTPSVYLLFSDRVVIFYGRPRLKSIPFLEIEDVDLIKLSYASSRLRLLQKGGQRTWLVPRDAEAFNEKFLGLLEQFRRTVPVLELPDQDQSPSSEDD